MICPGCQQEEIVLSIENLKTVIKKKKKKNQLKVDLLFFITMYLILNNVSNSLTPCQSGLLPPMFSLWFPTGSSDAKKKIRLIWRNMGQDIWQH